ncbi:type II/IV secretion system protein [Mageeibacillus indolicus UPII9-5]|uniref:Type II/IV secretion system protein n=1 Tax=Mageeibacillus indolicus (strain UPII9-5) TaxID=699246 RepID=D3R1J6_MAGIU|nr:ATPase, T2SS/T4P/T4SS family [Mageeibacillus indolicus]ADC90694.1 type II/IV secretion system protein [Mageeibacillus indolicus UPII9-5]
MAELDQALINEIKHNLLTTFSPDTQLALRREIAIAIDRKLSSGNIALRLRNEYINYIFNSIVGLDVLQPLMDDPSITEIMVNGKNTVFVERHGKLQPAGVKFNSQQHLEEVITGIFARANKELSLGHPITDLRLEDGSRANAVLAPIAPDGPVLTIRKFTGILPTPDEIVASGCLNKQAMEFLAEAIKAKESIFICGGTSAGKTTLLNALSTFIPVQERIITVEDSAELQLRNQPNLVKLEARPGTVEGQGSVTIADLIKTALRMRPDRIIVGEVRGDEAYMLIHAANTGHPGTLCTGHGNSSADMLIRLTNMISGCTRLPYQAILRNLVTSIRYMINIKRLSNGRRRVMSIDRVIGCDEHSVNLSPVFIYDEINDCLKNISDGI